MNARNILPVVVLLTLTAPPAGAAAAGAGGGAGVARRAAPAGLSAAPETRVQGRGEPRSRRRGGAGGASAVAPEDVAGAAEYLRRRAEGPDVDAPLRQAWERFYPACDSAIRKFAASFRSRGIDVDDCAQEVWVDLLKKLPAFELDRSRGRFTSWLYPIVRNKAADQVRRKSRRAAEPLSPRAAADLTSPRDDPGRAAERQAEGEAVRQALAALEATSPERSYRVLYLRRVCGWPVRRVADSLGMTPQQVWVREHRMKRKLRELLRRDESALQ